MHTTHFTNNQEASTRAGAMVRALRLAALSDLADTVAGCDDAADMSRILARWALEGGL